MAPLLISILPLNFGGQLVVGLVPIVGIGNFHFLNSVVQGALTSTATVWLPKPGLDVDGLDGRTFLKKGTAKLNAQMVAWGGGRLVTDVLLLTVCLFYVSGLPTLR